MRAINVARETALLCKCGALPPAAPIYRNTRSISVRNPPKNTSSYQLPKVLKAARLPTTFSLLLLSKICKMSKFVNVKNTYAVIQFSKIILLWETLKHVRNINYIKNELNSMEINKNCILTFKLHYLNVKGMIYFIRNICI